MGNACASADVPTNTATARASVKPTLASLAGPISMSCSALPATALFDTVEQESHQVGKASLNQRVASARRIATNRRCKIPRHAQVAARNITEALVPPNPKLFDS